jgi:hypothetical protein
MSKEAADFQSKCPTFSTNMILKKFLATFASNNWQIIFSRVSLESIMLQTHKETLPTTLTTWLLLATMRNATADYIKVCHTFYKYKPT